MDLVILSGGAAHGLIESVSEQFKEATGATVKGTFGAVGAMKASLLSGAPADLLILTKAMIAELEKSGYVQPGTAYDIGAVPTSVAVRKGNPLPLVGNPELLKQALLEADELFVPDTKQSTAGIHIAGMLKMLGIDGQLRSKLKEFPNGAAAMKALASAKSGNPIGCTQRTEILATQGITFVRDLPAGCGLATVYTAAIAAKAVQPDLADMLITGITSEEAVGARSKAGFEPV